MNVPPSARAVSAAPQTAGRRLSRAALGAHLRIPLYREGYALVLNSAVVSVFGVVYWLVAARHYSPQILGLNAAAISAMMFLAGVAQLNLMSALTRFIPIAGPKSTRFVLTSYLVSIAAASGVVLVFLVGLESWAPELGFLSSTPGFVLWFIAATMAWCVFNLQDSALIGLRAAVFVPIENLIYSVAKIVLLVAFVGASPHYGIFASWTAALLLSLVAVNLLIFKRLLPRHMERSRESVWSPTRRQLVTFVSADYLGSLFWLASTTLMPVIIVAVEGATANAYFSLAWMIALPLYAVAASTGSSLVVTASRDEQNLPSYARQVLTQTAAIVIPLALVLAATAPLVLRLFGAEYGEHSSTTLVLLALSAIPNIVNMLYVSVYRVQRRMSRVVMVLGVLCGLAMVLGIVLLATMGVTGVGLAWLLAQGTVAAILMATEPHALGLVRRADRPGGAANAPSVEG
jgi:O-antigen/teichoic acid export membrane protein